MGKNSRAATAARAAAMQAEAARKERQRKQLIAAVVAVLVVIGAVVVGIVVAGGNSTPNAKPTGSDSVLAKLGQIPETAFTTAGAPTETNSIPAVVPGGTALMDGDKPRLIYVGGEFCPYCAGERWALVAALERFGSFTGLKPTRSATDDGNIPTVTFKDATYTSDYVTFQGIETMDRDRKPLQTMPDDVKALFTKYNPQGGVPWTFFGTHVINGSGVPLAGFNSHLGDNGWSQIVDQILTGSGDVGASIDAHANAITAQLCQQTKGQPSAVCTSPAVVAATAMLKK